MFDACCTIVRDTASFWPTLLAATLGVLLLAWRLDDWRAERIRRRRACSRRQRRA